MKNYQADMQTAFDPTGAKPSNFQFYFGPNHFKTLLASNDLSFKDKDLELEDLVYLGWPIIRLINRWFTINLFDWLSSWGLSMGMVILLMTIIVKILVLPTTWKSFISSAKMRALKPYVDKINAKYPKQEDALKKPAGNHGTLQPVWSQPDGRLLADAASDTGVHGTVLLCSECYRAPSAEFPVGK